MDCFLIVDKVDDVGNSAKVIDDLVNVFLVDVVKAGDKVVVVVVVVADNGNVVVTADDGSIGTAENAVVD